MINIQDEVQKIHHQYGMSEVANYKIQLLFEKYAKEYHESEVKKLNIPAVSNSVCRYYGINDCKDFQPYKGILYGLCKSENWCVYKNKPNKDDIVESEL